MSENGIRGVDLFKIAGESISGWIPSWKLGGQKPTRQPFCSLMVLTTVYNWLILVFGEALGESFHLISSSQSDMRSLSVV